VRIINPDIVSFSQDAAILLEMYVFFPTGMPFLFTAAPANNLVKGQVD
jgi:hypothetical protein